MYNKLKKLIYIFLIFLQVLVPVNSYSAIFNSEFQTLSLDNLLIKNSFDGLCSNKSLYDNKVLTNETVLAMCNVVKKSKLCENVKKEELRSCQLNSQVSESSPLDLLSSCATGLFESIKDLLDFVWQVMKFAWSNATDTKKRSETTAQASAYMESASLYLNIEYEKSYEESSSPFRKMKALSNMGESIAKMIMGLVQTVIEKEVQEFACLNQEAKTKYTCKLIGDLFFPPAFALALIKKGPAALKSIGAIAKAFEKTTANIKNIRSPRPLNSRLNVISTADIRDKRELVGRFLDYKATDAIENQKWINSAKANSADMFFDIENAALKRLNDTLGDKNLVTALTNLHKNIFFENLQQFSKKYPGIEIGVYSDFKSMRLSIKGKLTKKQQSELNAIFKSSNDEFAKKVDNISGLKELRKENQNQWFNAGLGNSADEAGLSVRKARDYNRADQTSNLITYSEIKKDLSRSLKNSDIKRKNLVLLLKNKNGHQHFLEKNGKDFVPTREFFEVMRKQTSKTNKEVSTFIRNKYGLDLKDSDINRLKSYHESIDQFSPGIWVKERVVANLDKAHNGGFSADFAGMGAENLRQVALDVSRNSNNIDKALVQLRKGEEYVTKIFNHKKSEFLEISNKNAKKMSDHFDIKCSGDDCVAVPKKTLSLEDKKEIISTFARESDPASMRMSFIPKGVRQEHRTIVAVHGELVEKSLRAKITGLGLGKIGPDKMKQLLFALDMPKELGRGKINLIVGKGKGHTLDTAETNLMKKLFKEAVNTVNKDLSRELGKNIKYSSDLIINAN